MGRTNKIIQNSMVSGILSENAIGRIDIAKYYNGLAEADNMIVEPLGGIKKRQGFEYLATLDGEYRIVDFIFDTAEKYIILFGNNTIKIWDIMNNEMDTATLAGSVDEYYYNNSTGEYDTTTYTSQFYTLAQIPQLSVVQQADTMIITHEDVRPQKLVRQRTGSVVTGWTLEPLELKNIPQFDFDANRHDAGASRKYKIATDSDSILSLKEDIMNAISLGEAGLGRTPYVNTEVVSSKTSTAEVTETKTITRDWIKVNEVSGGVDTISVYPPTSNPFDPEGAGYKWGTAIQIDYNSSVSGESYDTLTVVYDKDLEEIVQEAIRNRISLKDQNNGLLTTTQLQNLLGADFSAEVEEIINGILDDYDSVSSENVWSDTRGWPRYCTFYQNRLWFAGTKSKPQTIWGSVTNDFFNFDISESDDDYALADTLNTNTLNNITGMYPGRVLQVFTTGGEFINAASPVTPKNSIWAFQSGYGSSANVPCDSLDGSTLYIDRAGAIREFVYDFNQDAWVAADRGLLAKQVIKNPDQLVIVKSSLFDISKLVYFRNEDGTLAVLNIDNNEKILAWTTFSTNGIIESIAGIDQSILFVVNRNGVRTLEILGRKEWSQNYRYDSDLDVFLDGFQDVYGTLADDACEDSVGGATGTDFLLDGIWSATCKIFSGLLSGGSKTIDGLDRFEGQDVTVMLDGFYQGTFTVTGGEIEVSRDFIRGQVGLAYSGRIKTLPLSNPQYPNQLDYKRIIKVATNLYKSAGITVNGRYITDRQFDIYDFGTPTKLYTGIKETFQLGWKKLKQFEIESDYPFNFHLLSFTTVIESNGMV